MNIGENSAASPAQRQVLRAFLERALQEARFSLAIGQICPKRHATIGAPPLRICGSTFVSLFLLFVSQKDQNVGPSLNPPALGVEPINGTLFKRDPGGLGGTVLTVVLPILL